MLRESISFCKKNLPSPPPRSRTTASTANYAFYTALRSTRRISGSDGVTTVTENPFPKIFNNILIGAPVCAIAHSVLNYSGTENVHHNMIYHNEDAPVTGIPPAYCLPRPVGSANQYIGTLDLLNRHFDAIASRNYQQPL